MSSQGLLNQDSQGLPNSPGQPAWGIYLNGAPVILADSVISFEYKKDYTLSDYPVEQGGFATYDKVELPFDVRFTFSKGGSDSDRQDFLNSVEAIKGNTILYDAYIPECIYTNVNVSHYDFRRTSSNGLGLLVINIYLIQVRVTGEQAFSNTQNAGSANPQNNGNVQAQPPNQNQQSLGQNFLDGLDQGAGGD